jgi:hypothetical protein
VPSIYCSKRRGTQKAALGNSTLPTVCDKLNVMSTIHLSKLVATLVREAKERDSMIDKLEEKVLSLEQRLNEMRKQPNTELPCDC